MHSISLSHNGENLLRELESLSDCSLSKSSYQELFPGAVLHPSELDSRSLVFRSQLLPNCTLVTATSISKQVASIRQYIFENLPRDSASWMLHLVPNPHDEKLGPRRLKLVEDSLLESIKGAVLNKLSQVPGANPCYLMQVLFISCEQIALSCSRLGENVEVSPQPAGQIEIPENKLPPSRAYRKLLEAISIFGDSPKKGELVLDLGCCPGGWSYVALEYGAKVLGVDRTPPDTIVASNRNFKFEKGDAFSYKDSITYDWIICDVIAEPARNAELLTHLISNKKGRNFIFTLKFKGFPDIALINGLVDSLHGKCKFCLAKQLFENKNEVTIMAIL